jgi:hypothetical protein
MIPAVQKGGLIHGTVRSLVSGVLSLVICWTIGCTARITGSDTTTTSESQKVQSPAGTTAARLDAALVRFINADSNAGGLDLWSGDVRTFSNVAYKMITPYVELPAQVGQFRMREVGGTQDLGANLREMFPGRHYTLVALPRGYRSSRLALLHDDLGTLEPGQTRVRLINATSDVDDLDLYIQGTNTRIGHGVDPGIANSFTDVKAGLLDVRQRGKPAIKQLTNLKVEADRLYTFILTGTTDAMNVVRIEDRVGR